MGDMADCADSDLMGMISSGKLEALGEVYDRYAKSLYHSAFRVMNNHADAEDLLQDVFDEVRRKAGNYDSSRGRLYTWMLSIVRSRGIDRVRARGRYSALMEGYGEVSAIKSAEDVQPETTFEDIDLRGLLDGLSDNHKEVLCLSYLNGMTQREVASRLGLPLGTVKSRLHFAVQNIRRRYDRTTYKATRYKQD